MNKINKKGFTLIELLAVIIILGVLMIIAIPAVTKYIDDSRKESYITTAKELISGAKNMVNSGKLKVFDTDTTYYIPSSCIRTETGGQSPYGEFDKAYVVVTYEPTGFNYYWISRDTSGIGIKFLTPLSELDKDLILSSIEKDEITTSVGVGDRSKIEVVSESDCKSMDEVELTDRVTENGERLVVVYPEGKSREDLVVGDIVKIINEEFYVLNYDSSKDELRLLSKYNLNVGNRLVPGAKIGIQNSQVVGGNSGYGVMEFAETAYWVDQVGPGKKYPGIYGFNADETGVANIYDSNCNPYKYVQAYVKYFEDNRVHIKSSGILSQEEAYRLEQNGFNYIVNATSSWTSTPSRAGAGGWVMVINKLDVSSLNHNTIYQGWMSQGSFNLHLDGVRPVIVI